MVTESQRDFWRCCQKRWGQSKLFVSVHMYNYILAGTVVFKSIERASVIIPCEHQAMWREAAPRIVDKSGANASFLHSMTPTRKTDADGMSSHSRVSYANPLWCINFHPKAASFAWSTAPDGIRRLPAPTCVVTALKKSEEYVQSWIITGKNCPYAKPSQTYIVEKKKRAIHL